MTCVDATRVHSTELSSRRPPRRQPWLAIVHKLNVVRHQRPVATNIIADVPSSAVSMLVVGHPSLFLPKKLEPRVNPFTKERVSLS